VAPSIRKKLALTSLTSGGRSVGIVRLPTEATDFFIIIIAIDVRLVRGWTTEGSENSSQ
jgi:hypothetical protein